ncbi:MAG: DNA-directed RNA polymerase subunit K [Candidatus Nanohaloarchaea archaeon]|nr:DNA-directed RNA polymerase subunit K [Candidatus Nanohaloarchaea archaeon]
MINLSKDYTRFEKARLVGARALQLSEGAPPMIDTDKTNSVKIAEQELEEGVLPVEVDRKEHGKNR